MFVGNTIAQQKQHHHHHQFKLNETKNDTKKRQHRHDDDGQRKKNQTHSNELSYPLVIQSKLAAFFFLSFFFRSRTLFFPLPCCCTRSHIFRSLLVNSADMLYHIHYNDFSSSSLAPSTPHPLFSLISARMRCGESRDIAVCMNGKRAPPLSFLRVVSYFESFIIFVWIIFVSYFTAHVSCVRVCGQKKKSARKMFRTTKDVVNSYTDTIITVLFSDGRIFRPK